MVDPVEVLDEVILFLGNVKKSQYHCKVGSRVRVVFPHNIFVGFVPLLG